MNFLESNAAEEPMAENLLSNRPLPGRTFLHAMWTAGSIAAVLLFTVAWAMWKRPPSTDVAGAPNSFPAEAYYPTVPPPVFSEGATPGMVGSAAPPAIEGSATSEPPAAQDVTFSAPIPTRGVESGEVGSTIPGAAPEIGNGNPNLLSDSPLSSGTEPPAVTGADQVGPNFQGPVGADSPTLSDALTNAAFEAGEIEDPILERLVSTGEELRSAGNMQGALQALREAEAALPENPRIMGELAATYQQMGLAEKAGLYWERIEALGEAVGGPYYALARRQLRGEEVPAEGAANQLMRIHEVKVEDRTPNQAGNHVALRVTIESDPRSRLIGDDTSLLVFFYDTVDGARVEASTAETTFDFPSKPFDWQDTGKEEIVVTYQQPEFTIEQRQDLGERKYYGYAIELYYQDVLQDRIVMPEDIEELRLQPSFSAPDGTPSIGPENALFPDAPNF